MATRIAVAEAPETITTRLDPGLNYVGWVGPDTPVEELFAAVPQIEAVFSWSWQGQQWLMASADAPPGLNTLHTLRSGRGLAIRVGADEPLIWTRSFSRGSGYVWLGPGWNLVGWSGDRGELLSELDRHARRSFNPAYDPTGEYGNTNISVPGQPELTDEYGRIESGDALWIRVDRGGYWVQRDDAFVWIRGQYTGPDGEGVADIIVNATSLEGEWSYAYTRSDGSFSVHVRRDRTYRLWSYWPGSCNPFYREGGATKDGDLAPRLRITEGINDLQFHVPYGVCGLEMRGKLTRVDGSAIEDATVEARATTKRLTASGRTTEDGSFEIKGLEDDSYIISVGLDGGCSVYRTGSGTSLLYDEAVAVSVSNTKATEVDVQLDQGICEWRIRGGAISADGTPVADAPVRLLGEGRTLWTTTESDGTFLFTAPANGEYQILLKLEHCDVTLTEAGATRDRSVTPRTIVVSDADVSDVLIAIPPNPCGWPVSGVLRDVEGKPLDDVQIDARGVNTGRGGGDRTNAEGQFKFFVPERDDYLIKVWITGGCRAYYNGEELVAREQDAEPVEVRGADVDGLVLRVAQDVCRWNISGSVMTSDGMPLEMVSINFEGLLGPWANTHTEADGSFKKVLPQSDEYSLWLRFNRCPLFFDGRDAVAWRENAVRVRVDGADVSSINITLPDDLCQFHIRGRVFTASGDPFPNPSVWAYGPDNQYIQGHPAPDGFFSVLVPDAGDYRIAIKVGNCFWWVTEHGVSSQSQFDGLIRVGDGDVTGIEYRLPKDSDSFCD